jgi:HEAT repeat protein
MFLVDGLKSDKPAIRLAALQALEGLSASADIVGPALVAALKDSDPQVASQAIDMLGSMGSQLTPEIVKALKTPSLREYALRIIYRFGGEAKSAVPELIELLKDPQLDPRIRRETHFVLGQIGLAAAPATPQLIAALGSDNERVRNSAIFAIGRIGPGAYEAAPALEKLAASDDEFLRIGCLWALVGVKPGDAALAERATPELIKGLSSEREMVRLEAARTLGALGPEAKVALPALRKFSEDANPAVAEAVVKAIAAIEARKTSSSDASGSGSEPKPASAAGPATGAPAKGPSVKPSPVAKPAR